MKTLTTIGITGVLGAAIAYSITAQNGSDDPGVIATAQVLSGVNQQLPKEAEIAILSMDRDAEARSAEAYEKQYLDLVMNGMETGRTGWHVLLPVAFGVAENGMLFPSVYEYKFRTGWYFHVLPGFEGVDYYPMGSVRNGRSPAGYPKEAAAAFDRAFPNILVKLSPVADSAGTYTLEAHFEARTIDYLENVFGPKATTATSYQDWFGVGHALSAPPTQRRITVVSDNQAYIPVDLDNLFDEHETNQQATLVRVVATGLTLSEANTIIDGK